MIFFQARRKFYGSFATQIQHVCVCDYLVHQLYICDVHVVGAHDVCFTIHLRATFRLRLFGARGPLSTHTVMAD